MVAIWALVAMLFTLLVLKVYPVIASVLDSNDSETLAQNINSALPLKFDFTKYSLNREESYVQIQWNTTHPEASSDLKAAPNDITYQIQILTSNGTWIKQPCEEETVNDRLMTCKIMVDRMVQKLGPSLSGDEVVIRIVAKEDGKETYSASYEIELGA